MAGPREQELAAWLDGEAPRSDADRLERDLARDPALARDASQLRQAWDMLDYLEMPVADGAFTSRTLSVVRGHTPAPRPVPPEPPWPWWLAVAAALGAVSLALAVGATLGRSLSDADAALLAEPQFHQRLPIYRRMGDLETARSVAELFPTPGAEPDTEETDEMLGPAPGPPPDGRGGPPRDERERGGPGRGDPRRGDGR